MSGHEKAVSDLEGMLKVAGLSVKPSYHPGEVQTILGVSERAFWSMITGYEVDHESGKIVDPSTLDSFMLRRSRRVRHGELVDFLRRNNTYERVCG